MLIDVTRLLNRAMAGRLPTGVDRVGLEYLRNFGSHSRMVVRVGGCWRFLRKSDSERVCEFLLGDAPASKWWMYGRLIRGVLGHSDSGVRSAIFMNTGHSGLELSGYGETIKKYALRPIFFLHDLIPIQYPEYCRPGEAEKHRRRVDLMLSLGCGLVVNSKNTLDALTAYAAIAGRNLPPCVVAPLAPGLLVLKDGMDGRLLDQPYFVMVGTIEPRKNHLLILNLWRELAQTLGARCPRLVLIGQRGWECEQVVDMLERCPALQSVVIERQTCSDTEMRQWLMGARAMLFPSFSEGFGMPLVEALLLRVPILASQLDVFQEIAGDIPEYLHPLDAMSWKTMVLDYMTEFSGRRQSQLQRMAAYAPPDWASHFELVACLLESLGGYATT